MTIAIRRNWLFWTVLAAVLLLAAYAWIDGGREPLREMSEPAAMPEPRG